MKELKILNSREIRNIKKIIKSQWDADLKLDYAFLMNDKGRIFIINRELGDIDFSKLHINNLGLYFGELKTGELRLSIEGSQMVGIFAKKNMVDIDDKNLEVWMKGEDIEIKADNLRGFVIIKNNKDFLGCGKYKEGKVLNYVPKERRVHLFQQADSS